MGFLANNQCYSTRIEAAQAVCGTYPITSFSADGASVYTWSCMEVVSSGFQLNLMRTVSGSASISNTYQYLNFPSCQESNFYSDSSELWALGLVAVVVIWAFKNTVLKLFFPA